MLPVLLCQFPFCFYSPTSSAVTHPTVSVCWSVFIRCFTADWSVFQSTLDMWEDSIRLILSSYFLTLKTHQSIFTKLLFNCEYIKNVKCGKRGIKYVTSNVIQEIIILGCHLLSDLCLSCRAKSTGLHLSIYVQLARLHESTDGTGIDTLQGCSVDEWPVQRARWPINKIMDMV